MDHFVVKWLGEGDPELKRAVTRHRRRKLTARLGMLRLIQFDRTQTCAVVTLPQDVPIPIAEDAGEAFGGHSVPDTVPRAMQTRS